jgi:hypothetical protein
MFFDYANHFAQAFLYLLCHSTCLLVPSLRLRHHYLILTYDREQDTYTYCACIYAYSQALRGNHRQYKPSLALCSQVTVRCMRCLSAFLFLFLFLDLSISFQTCRRGTTAHITIVIAFFLVQSARVSPLISRPLFVTPVHPSPRVDTQFHFISQYSHNFLQSLVFLSPSSCTCRRTATTSLTLSSWSSFRLALLPRGVRGVTPSLNLILIEKCHEPSVFNAAAATRLGLENVLGKLSVPTVVI